MPVALPVQLASLNLLRQAVWHGLLPSTAPCVCECYSFRPHQLSRAGPSILAVVLTPCDAHSGQRGHSQLRAGRCVSCLTCVGGDRQPHALLVAQHLEAQQLLQLVQLVQLVQLWHGGYGEKGKGKWSAGLLGKLGKEGARMKAHVRLREACLHWISRTCSFPPHHLCALPHLLHKGTLLGHHD